MTLQTCRITGRSFEIPNREKALCERWGLFLPSISPPEQLRQLMSFRNERKLYRRTCDASGKTIISAYRSNSPFKVFENSQWWSDAWEGLDKGMALDFNRPFFHQFIELQKKIPREGTSIFNCENCDYNGHLRQSKNCYLNALGIRSEDCLYNYWTVRNKDCVDCLYVTDSTLCYESIHLNHCYDCIVVEEASSSTECYFSFQLRACDHCLFCTNLSNKSYYLFNKPCSKEEFEQTKKKYLSGSWTAFQEGMAQWETLKQNSVHRYAHNLQCENCTGDHLVNCKNCRLCFEGGNSEDCYNLMSFGNCKDVSHVYSCGWEPCEEVYCSAVIRGSQRIAFSNYIWFSSDLWYCDSCVSCERCFGCVGLRHKQYCILNKQYTKEGYEALMPQLVEHMKKTGEWSRFFPQEANPFAYNETPAQDFFPISKERAIALGFDWLDEDKQNDQPATLKTLPDDVQNVKESLTEEILACELCGKNYRIVPQELRFYRNLHLPIPRHCWDCRHRRRFQAENPPESFVQRCQKCSEPLITSYPLENSPRLYCEKCYLEKIY